jgi:hypothetical protein
VNFVAIGATILRESEMGIVRQNLFTAILLGGENRIGFGERAEEVETTIIDFYV